MYFSVISTSPIRIRQGRRNFLGRSSQGIFSAEEESFDDSKAYLYPQDSKAAMTRGKRAVPCPTNACMSTPCDGGYGALLCVPQNVIYFDIECDGHFTDLCIASSHVGDALSMGAVCGTCPTDKPRQLARKLPCSSFPPMMTETTIRLDEFTAFNLFNILAARKENTASTDQRLYMYNVTKEVSSLKVGNETFFLEGGGDVVSLRIEECDASVTIFSNGTTLASGGKEPCEVCFDYTVTSREESGGIVMLGMATETGTHCINIRPHHAFTATVGEIGELLDHSIAQSILSGFSDDDNSLDGGSIVKIIIPSGMDEADGNAEVIVPRAGDVLILHYGNMTIDPVSGMMLYTPNPSHMESLGEDDEFIEYFDYVSVDQDGTSSMERVTIRVIGEEMIAAADLSTIASSSKPSSAPTEGPTSTPSSKPSSVPSPKPTEGPTNSPSSKPSSAPTEGPTSSPSSKPSSLPTPKPTNAPPIAEDNTYGRTVEELNNADGTIIGEILTNDSDPDGALGEFTITSITPVGGDGTVTPTAGTVYRLENGNFTIDPDTGSVEYTPDPAKVAALSGAPGSVLTDAFTYIITDADGGTDEATVTFTIVGQNDPPVPEDDSETVPEGGDVSDCVL